MDSYKINGIDSWTVGSYVSHRLTEIGVEDYFVVPGDYVLAILDEMLKNKALHMIQCCNELNAGYAADGYAREKGASAVVVTYAVGGLSLLNSVAGAFAADLSMVVISGAPHSDDLRSNRALHHSIDPPDWSVTRDMFRPITVDCALINNPIEAPYLIDRCISAAMTRKKPVYLEISCNVATAPVPPPVPTRFTRTPSSHPLTQLFALEQVVQAFNRSTRPVLIVGRRIKMAKAKRAFVKFAEACGSAVAVMADAKGLFDEQHPQFIGVCWGPISTNLQVQQVVESADLMIFVGPDFTDMSTAGYSMHLPKDRIITIGVERVRVTNGKEYGCVYMSPFLSALAARVKAKPASMALFRCDSCSPQSRIQSQSFPDPSPSNNRPLTIQVFAKQVQDMLKGDHAVLVETGDSWFVGERLTLPEGAKFEIQAQYVSTGWSVGAVLGYSLALKHAPFEDQKRVVALIGDGSFQMTAQEVSTMIRYRADPIIFLLNNDGYTVISKMHDGPYTSIQQWNYSALVEALVSEHDSDRDHVLTWRARTEEQLSVAIAAAAVHKGLAFIEVIVAKDDCSSDLPNFGKLIATSTMCSTMNVSLPVH